MAKLGDGGEYNPMTSPTQRAGADDLLRAKLRTHAIDCERAADMSTDFVIFSDQLTDMVEVMREAGAAIAALQARIAELEARNAASERDALRWKWVYDRDAWVRRKYAIGPAPVGYYVVSAEREGEDATVYPVRATREEAIDAAIDAHAQGQAGEEK